MALEIQVSRTQKIVFRVIIALLILGVLATLLRLNLAHTKIVKDGNTTIYIGSDSLYFAIQTAFLGLAACIIGVFYGKQRHIFFRFAGVAIFFTGLFILFNSPTGLNHKLVVTPDYFYQRIGSWYSPQEIRVEFKQVIYMDIGESHKMGSGQKYDLRCTMNAATNEVRIQINYLLKAALPEIYSRASESKVFIGDGPDGQQIPSDL